MTLPEAYRGAVTFTFGDSPELADALLALVLAGRKTATCGALRTFDTEPTPEVGRRDVVLDGLGRPAAVIETLEVAHRRFDEVDPAFARDQGEGDGAASHPGAATTRPTSAAPAASRRTCPWSASASASSKFSRAILPSRSSRLPAAPPAR